MPKDPIGGRLVLTHSTHIDGLIPVLRTLIQHPDIQTVTPGVIGQARSNSPSLRLRISVPTRGGFKLVARKGKSVQDVFIVTSLPEHQLQLWISDCLGQ